MRSTLFLHNITAIDYAYIDAYGILRGGSYHLSVNVSGEVFGAEQVVVDFSTLKHDIKKIVDGAEGYDHKLWLIPECSNAKIEKIDEQIWEISNPYCTIHLPENAIKFFEFGINDKHFLTAKTNIEHTLLKELQKKYPDVNISIEAILTTNMFYPESNLCSVLKFRYVHGLKDSTSWGCQNIAHGHLSFICFKETNKAKRIDGTSFEWLTGGNNIFIFKDNVIEDNDQLISIKYTTCRGEFSATFNKLVYNVIVLDKETTIENITEWFYDTYKDFLLEHDIKRLYISEGLQKGSVIGIDYDH